MKNYSQLFPDAFCEVHIKWSNPIKLSQNWEHLSLTDQTNSYLYRIIAKRGDKYKLVYIGMTENQEIHVRLSNRDHKAKQGIMKDLNNGWVLYLSVGDYIVKNEDLDSFNWAVLNTKIIEKLLIISHSEIQSLVNKKGVNWFSTGVWLTICNHGFLKDNLLKNISYGIFKR
jgi:hypothetical protein